MPTLLRRASPERLIKDLLDELSRAGDRAYGDAVDMAIATMACHASIRGGDTLSVPECQALLRAMDEVGEFRGHCPHGRPVVYDVSFAELEKRREIAYTTVMTTVSRLYDKGLLDRVRDGRRYLYSPKLTREQFLESTAWTVLDEAVGGQAAMAMLVDKVSEASAGELDALEQLIRQRREELGS